MTPTGVLAKIFFWRVGSWLVGLAIPLALVNLVKIGNGGLYVWCLLGVVTGLILSFPHGRNKLGRDAQYEVVDHLVRPRPLGLGAYVVLFLLFVFPYAVGDAFLHQFWKSALWTRRARQDDQVFGDVAVVRGPYDEPHYGGHYPEAYITARERVVQRGGVRRLALSRLTSWRRQH